MSARRRRRGDGSVFEYRTAAGIRFRITWRVPINPDDPDAGTKRKTQAGFTTKGEAAKALRAAVTEVETGRATVDTKVTVSQFAADWLAGRRASTSTVETYRRYVRLHIDPHIGSVPLVDLRAARIARLYRDLEARGNHDRGKEGTGLGPNSVRKVHALLVSILDGALAEHLIATNPAKLPQANPPTAREVKSAKPEIHPWTAAQLKAFLSWCPHDDTDLSMGWIVVGRTGLRRGELLGLQWRYKRITTSYDCSTNGRIADNISKTIGGGGTLLAVAPNAPTNYRYSAYLWQKNFVGSTPIDGVCTNI
ncbi:site-specific integrase [Oerskovia merdavium]|uniref:Core-binding (CB) domain-containing protein n=1 Tax=Oerskovia merdavium TaxID=2762227 RepID=A0ABR8U3C6_9CELL|nr:hypothetical protein [Oerskovia merdavium]MBD7982548.1 hypothetical protein [Oerskovia merdavium]